MRNELLAEAKFYQVQGIITQLEGKIFLCEDTLIIKKGTHQSTLQSWLPPNATCSLLYRSSTDGNASADFHRCCNNRGPTLVLIKVEEYIFGGYTSRSWDSGICLWAIDKAEKQNEVNIQPSVNKGFIIRKKNTTF